MPARRRSRQRNCSTVSMPAWRSSSSAAASGAIRARLAGRSVTSSASTPRIRSWRPSSTNSCVAWPRGGSSSTASTNWPRDERAREARLLGARHRRHDGRRRHGGHGRPGRAGPAAGRRRRGGDAHLARVLRRRAAAAADQAHAGGDEAPRVGRHVLRRREIDVAALDVARPSGVGLHREARRRALGDPLDRLEHRRRPDAAVQADDVGAERLELRGELLRRRAVGGDAVVAGGELRDHRLVRDGADAADGGAELGDVAEGLEHEQVDAGVGERLRPARGTPLPPRRGRSCPTARRARRAGRWRRRRRPGRAPPDGRCARPRR